MGAAWSWLAEQAPTVGVTIAATLAAVWGGLQFFGAKYFEHHLTKKLADHKKHLDSRLGKELADHKKDLDAKLGKELADHKKDLDAGLQVNKSELDAKLEERKNELIWDLEEWKNELTERTQNRLAKMGADIAEAQEIKKARLAFENQTSLSIAEKRLGPYRALWSIMEPVSPRSSEPFDRDALYERFKRWFYADGNGVFLKLQTLDTYLHATGLLKTGASEDAIRKAFSKLRTDMKVDLHAYTGEEAAKQVGSGVAPNVAPNEKGPSDRTLSP